MNKQAIVTYHYSNLSILLLITPIVLTLSYHPPPAIIPPSPVIIRHLKVGTRLKSQLSPLLLSLSLFLITPIVLTFPYYHPPFLPLAIIVIITLLPSHYSSSKRRYSSQEPAIQRQRGKLPLVGAHHDGRVFDCLSIHCQLHRIGKPTLLLT